MLIKEVSWDGRQNISVMCVVICVLCVVCCELCVA